MSYYNYVFRPTVVEDKWLICEDDLIFDKTCEGYESLKAFVGEYIYQLIKRVMSLSTSGIYVRVLVF